MAEVWKYPIRLEDISEERPHKIEMPIGATVLSVQAQNNQLCLWVLVDPHKAASARLFNIVGTGHFVTGLGQFLGTAQMYADKLVLHVWEVQP